MTDKTTRDAFMVKVKQKVQRWYDSQSTSERGPIGNYCWVWAYATVKVLNEAGINAQIQAGSAFWPCLPTSEEGGIKFTTYGFGFDWTEQTFKTISAGELPEIHVWAAITRPATIIDPVSFNFKAHALAHGMQWHMPDPPEYFWCQRDMDTWPEGVVYKADVQAIEYIHAMLHSMRTGTPFAMRKFRDFDK